MTEVILEWLGPYKLRELPQHQQRLECPGVYMWVERPPNDPYGFLEYAGKASGSPSLFARQIEHYHAYLGARYVVPLWAAQEYGREWGSALHDPKVIEILFDKQKIMRVISDAFEYAHTLDFYFAPYKGPQPLTVVERNLIWDLQPRGNSQGRRTLPGQPLDLLHKNATWRAAAKAARKLNVVD